MFDRIFFASRLKALRAAAGLSGLDLSSAVGLKNRGSIAQFETCRATPSADVLVALADFFCVSLDYLTGRDDDPQTLKYQARAEEKLLYGLPEPLQLVFKYNKDKCSAEKLPVFFASFQKIKAEWPDKLAAHEAAIAELKSPERRAQLLAEQLADSTLKPHKSRTPKKLDTQ